MVCFSESDEDLFGESKQQKQSYEEEGLFGKKSGLFSGGESLFDGEEVRVDDFLYFSRTLRVKF